MLWLTGDDASIAKIAKAYRVYYSASETLPGQADDYLVDHSIFFYLLDREGKFMEVFGKSLSAEQVADKITRLVGAENKK
jgi:protein SCO1/2